MRLLLVVLNVLCIVTLTMTWWQILVGTTWLGHQPLPLWARAVLLVVYVPLALWTGARASDYQR